MSYKKYWRPYAPQPGSYDSNRANRLEDEVEELRKEAGSLRARLAECSPFLKDEETPAECIARNRRDVDGCLTMLVAEKRKTESLAARLAEAEDAIERAGRCLAMSNKGAAEALAILRAAKRAADQPISASEEGEWPTSTIPTLPNASSRFQYRATTRSP